MYIYIYLYISLVYFPFYTWCTSACTNEIHTVRVGGGRAEPFRKKTCTAAGKEEREALLVDPVI